MSRNLKIFSLLATLAALLPMPAAAHLVSTGMGPLYDGAGHALMSPAELLPLLALGLLGGLHGARGGRQVVVLLPLAWLLGVIIGVYGGLSLATAVEGRVLALAALCPALLAAIDRRLPQPLLIGVITGVGIVLGVVAGSGLVTQASLALLLAGSLVAQCVVLVLLSGAVVAALANTTPQAAWRRIVVRVAASWIGAIALLMLGWQSR